MMNCKSCSKQYFCGLVNNCSTTFQNCSHFVSWIQTNNYGVPRRMEDEARRKNNSLLHTSS